MTVLAAGPAACTRPYSFEKLAFGMSRVEAQAALGQPLTYVSGAAGSETYVVEQSARVPGMFPSGERLYLQFRGERLTSWKGNWDMQKRLF